MKILNKYWPYLFVLILWFVFSFPYFVFGKAPFASDYQVNFFAPWSTYSELAGPVKNNAMPDVIGQIYPWRTLTIDIWKSGQVPLWNPYSFSGTPHLANYQSAVFSPLNVLFFALPFKDAWSIVVLIQPLLAALFMMLLLKVYKLSDGASLLGSIAFMFCGFITTWMGYATLGFAILFLPLAIFSIEKYLVSKKKIFLLLFSLTFPLSFFSGHFQISLYFLLFALSYLVFKFLVEKDKRAVLSLLAFLVFGMLISAIQIFPSIEAYFLSFRSEIFQKAEVIPWSYLPTLIAPDFFGNPVTRNDWFGHYAEWNAYVGLIPLVLGFYALLVRRSPIKYFFLVLSALSLLFSFQGPVLDLLVALKIPVLSTSAASRIIVIFSFSMAVLSAFGLSDLIKDIRDRKYRNISYILISFASIFALLWILVIFKILIPEDKISIAKQNLILPSLIFAAFSFLTLSSLISKKIGMERFIKGFILLVLVLVSLDVLRFATKWQSFQSKDLIFKDLPTTEEFKKISGVDRVFGNFGAEVGVYYKLPLVEGYDAVYIKRYGEFIASVDEGILKKAGRSVVSYPKVSENVFKVADLLGIKYIVHKFSDGQFNWSFPFWKRPEDFNKTYDDGKYLIYENRKVHPRAMLLGAYKIASSDEANIDLILSSDLRQNVILEEDPGIELSGEGNSSVEIVKYSPNEVVIKTTSDKNNLLFLSDSYHSGWRASVDGVDSKVYRANYTFRAVSVPKGEHEIKFVYFPDSFKWGIISLVGGLVGVVGYFFFSSQNLSSLSSNFFFAKKKR